MLLKKLIERDSFMKENLHKLKRRYIHFYKKYFTVENYKTYILSDKSFIKKMYKARLGRELDLRNPKTFTEKMNWLKLYDRRPEYTIMADKYAVREYITEKIGEEYLVPLLGVWDNADDIDFSKLPEKFVLKCNHNSDVTICTDKSKINEKEIKEKLNRQLRDDYYLHKREWCYKNIQRKIICEKYMENKDMDTSMEYKVYCFNGEPEFVLVCSDRFGKDGVKFDTYNMEWEYLNIQHEMCPMAGDVFERPENFSELHKITRVLSEGIPFVRVDFNCWNGKLYFGELTFYDAAGFTVVNPDEYNYIWGSSLKLPKKRRR